MRSLAALLVLASAPASAALSVSASVNKTTVGLDDQIALTVSVSADAARLPDPQVPSMPRFNVHSAGRSQSMTFVNGRITNSAEYTFVLVPRMVGNAVIPPFEVSAGGETAQTDPIPVTIVRPDEAPAAQGAAPPQRPGAGPAARARAAGPAPVFVTAETDKKAPYVNEQVIYTVRFHYSVPLLGNAEWSPPDTTGFLSEDLPPAGHQTASVEGRTYNVSEVKLALFPLSSGKREIGSGSIRCQVQRGLDVDPFASDFFRQFFSAGLTTGEPLTLATKPVPLQVRALPEAGKPEGFSGAVGRFKVRAAADKTSVKAGEAINLTITVEGSGNLKSLGELALGDLPEFRAYETVSSLNQTKDGAGVRGSKVYKTVIVPKVSGALRVPPIPFHYFDPGPGKYVTASTSEIALEVAPGDAAAPVGFTSGPGPSGAITTLAQDIRHVRSRAGAGTAARLAARAAGAGWLHAVPAALLALSAGLAFWRDSRDQDPARARARRAAKSASERLSRSRSARGLGEASALVGEALVGYVADRLAVPPAGLTQRQAAELLRRRWPRLAEGHLDQLRRLWGETERLRYAPTTVRDTDVAQLREAVSELVKALEEDAR